METMTKGEQMSAGSKPVDRQTQNQTGGRLNCGLRTRGARSPPAVGSAGSKRSDWSAVDVKDTRFVQPFHFFLIGLPFCVSILFSVPQTWSVGSPDEKVKLIQ